MSQLIILDQLMFCLQFIRIQLMAFLLAKSSETKMLARRVFWLLGVNLMLRKSMCIHEMRPFHFTAALSILKLEAALGQICFPQEQKSRHLLSDV